MIRGASFLRSGVGGTGSSLNPWCRVEATRNRGLSACYRQTPMTPKPDRADQIERCAPLGVGRDIHVEVGLIGEGARPRAGVAHDASRLAEQGAEACAGKPSGRVFAAGFPSAVDEGVADAIGSGSGQLQP